MFALRARSSSSLPLLVLSLALALALALVLSFVHVCDAAVDVDLITSLPGYGVPPTKQYSGYIPADDAQTVFLHYWFVTAAVNASTAPVVIWMNGGPGCSSMEGLLYEQGPFTFTGDIDGTGLPTLKDNPNAWSTVANMLFLEQPAGVGFSYAVNHSMASDDYIQSQNTYGFVLNFFKLYPEYAQNPFYITGESYAGIYVPTLANRIRMGNAAGNAYVNLKGFAVGNGCIGHAVGSCGTSFDSERIELSFYNGHGMISQPLWAAFNEVCNWTKPSLQCLSLLSNLTIGNINVYDVYDTCGDDLIAMPLDEAMKVSPILQRMRPGRVSKRSSVGDPVVCLASSLAVTYLTTPAVLDAIHISNASRKWQECESVGYTSTIESLLPLYPDLIAQYNVLIYSGDADACVPWVGSEEWTRGLGYTPQTEWNAWTVTTADNSWVGGFATVYNANFTYVTVKHAGHMVPQYEPESALTMFKKWLFNQGWN